jgi:hypothetical protein
VLGSTPSSIAGTINAPGTVLLVNPNGIAITSSGVVKTARSRRPRSTSRTATSSPAITSSPAMAAPAMLLGQRFVHQPPRFLGQRRQLARRAIAFRLVLHDEPAVPGASAVVVEAKEGEGFRTPLAPLGPRYGREATDLD